MRSNYNDLSGRRFGKLIVIQLDRRAGKHTYWQCVCDCGNTLSIRADCLKDGNTKSCGCLNHTSKHTVHGMAKTKLYHVYYGMKQRCYNPNNTAYKHYGARGITVCDEWLDDFLSFSDWAIQNGYREGLTIDRIDFDKGYSPNNCRWITQHEQTRNTRRNTLITIDGKTKLLCEWCEQYGVVPATACYRIKQGKPMTEVFGINNV